MTWLRLREAFELLVDLPITEQQARLAAIRRDEPELASRLHSLLATEAGLGDFLDRGEGLPTVSPGGAVPTPAVAHAGMRLGRFELVRPLGSGGMGTVWEARQEEPRRSVAIKLVARPDPSDMQRWRFQHEAQVLAALHHPAIATFHEFGTSTIGAVELAWIAMELVPNAVDIVTWAGLRALSTTKRLGMFVQLCEAVEHGHQRGVLHRDLKPGNALVDGEGRLKLIDFGIARALHGADRGPQHTATGDILGTIHYMAPEQLEGRTAAIGTASDVWSLGVILYQLLCGRLPFEVAGLPLAAVARVVIETEPMAPTAAGRGLPRDLGWVVLRALEKEPGRRYATARELAEDLERFLANQPVRAGPAGVTYRLRKFVRRHRVGVVAATAVAIVSGAAATMTALALVDTRKAEAAERRGRSTAEASLEFLVEVLSAPGPEKRGRETKIVDVLQRIGDEFGERFREESEIRSVIARALGRTMFGLGVLPEAERHLRASVADTTVVRGAGHTETMRVETELFHVLLKQGRLDEAEAVLQSVEAKIATAPADADLRDRIVVYRSDMQRVRGDRAGAAVTLRPVLERRQRHAPGDALTLQVTHQLAGVLHEAGDIEAAEPLYREALAGIVATRGEDHPEAITAMTNLAMVLQSHGRFEAALPSFERALEARRRKLGPTHIDTLSTAVGLGGLHARLRQFDAAAARLGEVLTAMGPDADERSPVLQVALANLAVVERDRKNWPRAVEVGERLLAMRQRTRGEAHPDTLTTMVTLADTRRQSGQVAPAIEQLTRCKQLAAQAAPPVVAIVYQCDLSLGWCHGERREFELAEQCLLRCLQTFDAAEQASANKGRLFRAEPDLVALYRLWGKPELAAAYESEHSRARDPDPGLQAPK